MDTMLWILNFIVDQIRKVTKIAYTQSAFHITTKYSPGSKSNPLIYVCKVTNKSTNAFVITEAYIGKVNYIHKYKLCSFKSILYEVPANEIDKLEGEPSFVEQIFEKLSKLTSVAQIPFQPKETKYLIAFYELKASEYEYWSNFELKMVNPGIILENQIIPAWFESNYQWILILKDEVNNYWISGNNDEYISNTIDYPIFGENVRVKVPYQQRLKLGIPITLKDIIQVRWKVIKFSYKYKLKTLAYKLGFRRSL